MEGPEDTSGEDYARRLQTKQQVWWKKALNVQAPYRWNLRRQRLGRTLDVGCGIGRNLETLDPGSVGVDHNEHSVAVAREAGVSALTVAEWEQSPLRVPESFDGILLAHVIEHMTEADGLALLRDYLPYLRPGGKVFFVCPQERGYASDADARAVHDRRGPGGPRPRGGAATATVVQLPVPALGREAVPLQRVLPAGDQADLTQDGCAGGRIRRPR